MILHVFAERETFAEAVPSWLTDNCDHCVESMSTQTGAYILEKGEESLIGRAWLTQNAVRTIDVQYFIWSTDNIGTLAAEYLLYAAERGVVVRVLVDDVSTVKGEVIDILLPENFGIK